VSNVIHTKTNVNARSSNSNNNKTSDDDGTDDGVSIAFDVYRSNSYFAKVPRDFPYFTRPPHTNHNRWTRTSSSRSTSASLFFQQIQRLLTTSASRSLKIATVSDAGAVIMFGITDHGVPAIQQGQSSDTTTNRVDDSLPSSGFRRYHRIL
jgi:hypothetical protein